ncbi:MAG TPA: phosphoenolpyruvate carboxylase [Xanthomonadaceae bacterium]|nr:phosphoenolpyruvate carboxylase [Xanthomonadaceae bacterium]
MNRAAQHENEDEPILREIEFVPTDQPLREDVRRLGALVGEVIAEQEGQAFFEHVERVRRCAIRRRESLEPMAALEAELGQMGLDGAEAMVRAFATWFGAVNLAERVHRIRRRRDYQKAGAAPQPGGLQAVIAALREDGVRREDLQALLARMWVEPVFTAHPTEAVRRALLEKEQDIVRWLVADLDRARTPQERRTDLERMRMALTSGWQTAESAPERPTVADELEHVGFYLGEVLFRVLPVFYEVLEDAVAQAYGQSISPPELLGFGSWVGGDMDGNPNVGADTIRTALETHRRLVIEAYRRDLRALARTLSQSTQRATIDPAVQERIAAYEALLPRAAARIRARQRDMPYRTLLRLMHSRLLATDAGRQEAYPDADTFVADLELIDASLQAHGGKHAGGFALRRTLRRARSFGFHLARLDLRQDARVHDAALAELTGDRDWAQRDPATRAQQLSERLADARSPVGGGATSGNVLSVFRALSQARARYGAAALGPYIVSMSRSAADALGVLALARAGGFVDAEGRVPLDVAPLFETVDDLEHAAQVVRALFADPHYREHLSARGDRQFVMLGYSDSAKDGGLMASRWALQRTQIALGELASEAGIRILFFHGRGGSVSRGGGKTERAVIAAPRGSVDGFLRVTEQGEVIHRKYGIRALALRTLEQTAGAVLRASLRPRPPEPREVAWRERMGAMTRSARAAYRALVHEDADFVEYFRAATPIDVIERLKLGSRPARRAAGGQSGIESLRAIPWVFAWSQNRAGLTGWYGVGTALSEAIAAHGVEAMAEMGRDWPFFATLLDDVEMVLAKSDLAVFERYSRLAGDAHARWFPRIQAEFERTVDSVLAIKGADTLLSGDRRLALSIRLRNPYVDPISVLQVDLLRRWREAGRPEDALFHALVATVNGIAAGVQNTG